MAPIHNPHDSLVKHIFGTPEAAVAELRRALPAALVERLNFSSLKVESGSFVDAELRHRVSDLLYTVELKGTKTRISIYVVMEHQSSPDHVMAARFVVYVGRFYERHLRENPGTKTVPLVIPLLLYQGPSGSTLPRQLSELIDAPTDMLGVGRGLVDLEFLVDDLAESAIAEQITQDQLLRDAGLALAEMARTMLWLHQHPEATDGARAERLPSLREVVQHVWGTELLRPFFVYFFHVFGPKSRVRAIMLKSASQETGQMYETIREQLLAEGFTKGEARGFMKGEATGFTRGEATGFMKGAAKGRVQGKAEATATMLESLLRTRGMVLSEALRTRVIECEDESRLQQWVERAIAATTLAQIFDE